MIYLINIKIKALDSSRQIRHRLSVTSQPENASLSAIINTLVDGLIFINDKGIIELFNPACEHIFQYEQGEVIGKNIRCLMPEPDRSAHDQYITNYKTTRTAKIIGIGRQVSGLRKNGEVFPMYLSVGEISDKKRTGFVGIIRDMTAEVRRSEAFEALQQEHFHLSRISAMDQMGAAIAHEVNQPLTAILNYLEAAKTLLESSDDFKSKPALINALAKSAQQGLRAAEIISRMRQFIETGQVDKTEVSLPDLVQPAVDLVRPLFKSSSIEIITEDLTQMPVLFVSQVQIQQVLVNLIRNGCEAMALTGGTLTIRARSTPSHVEISVVDQGPGLTDDAMSRLFTPFRSTKSGGLGVGLSISKTIIANHEGKLWAEKHADGGTTFCFSLPVITPMQSQ